jgi:hypothetical protein
MLYKLTTQTFPKMVSQHRFQDFSRGFVSTFSQWAMLGKAVKVFKKTCIVGSINTEKTLTINNYEYKIFGNLHCIL